MATRKSALRIASVGYTLHHPDVEDIGFPSSRTLLGQDVVLLKIGHLQYGYTGGYGASLYRGKVSLDDDASTRIVEDVARRRREIQTLLEVGGTLVLFLPPSEKWYVDSGKRQYSGTGRNRQTTHLVEEMQLLSVLPFPIDTVEAETRDLELKIGDPFATFWNTCGDRFQASAALKEAFGQTTLAIQDTETIVSSIAPVGKGLVIVLPEDLLYPAEDVPEAEEELDEEEEAEEAEDEAEPHPWDLELIDALAGLVRALRSTAGDFQQPEWAQEYLLPGEDEAIADVREAAQAVADAQKRLDEAQRALALREQRKTLVTGTGPALEALVEEALTALGFVVEEGGPGRSDRIARLGKQTAVLEIKGLTKSAGEKDAAQLEKWVNEYYLEHSEMPKGILVANGWRSKPLADRKQPVFPNQMLKYSESRGHCLISTVQLLGAWFEAERNPRKKETIAKSILTCVGRYPDFTDWSKFLTHEQRIVLEIGEATE